MSLPHALLVSLLEKPSTGIGLTRRFARSIGFFWTATHQQIYRELGRMLSERWIAELDARDPPDARQRLYRVTAAGRAELIRWMRAEHRPADFRDALSVKVRAAAILPEVDLRDELARHLVAHEERLASYAAFDERDFAHKAPLTRQEKIQRMILHKGMTYERWEIDWTRAMLALLDADSDGQTG